MIGLLLSEIEMDASWDIRLYDPVLVTNSPFSLQDQDLFKRFPKKRRTQLSIYKRLPGSKKCSQTGYPSSELSSLLYLAWKYVERGRRLDELIFANLDENFYPEM